jgi:hypothetical protein
MPGAPDTSLYIRACITSVRISLLNGDHGGISKKIYNRARRFLQPCVSLVLAISVREPGWWLHCHGVEAETPTENQEVDDDVSTPH